ncbi:hypothetical protein [Thalassiella azotivora]
MTGRPGAGPVYRRRLTVGQLAALGRSAPDLRLPEGFRPGPRGADRGGPDDVTCLREAGLLVEDGGRVAVCPLTAGLLRLLGAAAVRVVLRVHEDPAAAARGGPACGPGEGPGSRQWMTDAAAVGGVAARLTRVVQRSPDGGERAAEPVELAGYPVAHLPGDVAACVPGGERPAAGRPHRRPAVDVAAAGAPTARTLWLTVRTSRTTEVDTWWDDGDGWWRVRPGGAETVSFAPVDAALLRADLSSALALDATGASR